MILNTNDRQTQRLIDNGFPKPQTIVDWEQDSFDYVHEKYAYSIGELISFLPTEMEDYGKLQIDRVIPEVWTVGYDRDAHYEYSSINEELITALVILCLKLKIEKII